MCANRFEEAYEYMVPMSRDERTGEFITKKITLASSDTPSPFEMARHTLWCSIPGGYWDYTNPWTKKALDLIVGIQRDLDYGRTVSSGMNWHHCPKCNGWTNSYYIVCPKCNDDDYEGWEG